MNHFAYGFVDEMSKLAIDPSVKAWAVSRAITAGVAGGLMAGLTTSMTQRGQPKKKRTSVAKGAIAGGTLSAALGMGKGLFERGLEQKALKIISRH